MSQLKVNSIVPVGGLPSGSNGGIIQVVQTVKTDSFSVLNTTGTDITGMTVTITPSSNSNKILIACNLAYGDQGNGYAGIRLYRGSTNIGQSTAIDGENSDNTQDTAFCCMSESSQASYKVKNSDFLYLDSPATTSATTYKLNVITWTSKTFYLNRPYSIGNARYTMCGTSTITAYEVTV
jgi:hypothetical protein